MLKTLEAILVVDCTLNQRLDRTEFVHVHVPGLIYRAHASLSQDRENLIASFKKLTNEWIGCLNHKLLMRFGQSNLLHVVSSWPLSSGYATIVPFVVSLELTDVRVG